MKKNIYHLLGYAGIILSLVLTVSFINPSKVSATTAPSVTSATTVDHVDVGDQTANAEETTANVVEVKASSTIAFSSIPGTATTSTIAIGACSITFSTTTPTDSACADFSAVVKFGIASSTSELVTAVAAITGATSTHGFITLTAGVGAASSTLNVRTTGTETKATTIEFVPLVGKIATTSEAVGTIPVAQVETITIGGTPAAGNTFSFFSGAFSTSTISVDGDTNQTIANRLNTLIKTTTGYSALTYTSATGTNTIVLTAATSGTAFTLATTSVSNFTGTAQVVTFTPADTIGNRTYNYNIGINGATSSYLFRGGTVKTIVEGINDALATDSTVTCTEDDVTVTCTSDTLGVPFTYSTSVEEVVPTSSGSIGGSSNRNVTTPAIVVPTITTTTPADIVTLRAELTKQLVGLLQELLKQLVAELATLQ
jgi:hypothetical protein